MFDITPLTIIRASSGLQSQEWTWGSLCFKVFGAKNPKLGEVKHSLATTGFYDMGEGVILSATKEVAKYHKP